MKRILSIINMAFIMCCSIAAQDIITTKKGDEIKVLVTKVGANVVEYKKWTNQNGPIYEMNKDNIFMIKYKNGDKDVFGVDNSDNAGSSSPEITPKNGIIINNSIGIDNSQLIEYLNSAPINNDSKQKRSTKARMLAVIAGVEEESVLSNQDITISFSRDFIKTGMMKGEYVYDINIENKSNKILYIDKSACFIIDNENNAVQFFNPNEVSNTKGKNGGLSLTLGTVASLAGIRGTVGTIMNGLAVNGGLSSSTTFTEKDQQIIAIPPSSTIAFAKGLKIPLFNIDPKLLKMGQVKSYSYSDSPQKWTYFFSYSTDRNFSHYGSLSIKAYCKYLYGYMGVPVAGGNLVASSFLIKDIQFFSVFDCGSQKTTYNTWMPNVESSR